MQEFKISAREDGFGLVEVIVVAGLIGILVAIFSTFLSNSLKAQRTLELRGDKSAMQRTFVQNVSCSNTFSPSMSAACANGTLPLMGLTASGQPMQILPAGGKTVGSWTYRAECVNNNSVNIRAVHLRKNASLSSLNPADYVPDPLTGKILTWASPSTLMLPVGGELCNGGSGPLQTASGTVSYGSNSVNLGGMPQTVTLNMFASGFPAPSPSFVCTKDASMAGNTMACNPMDLFGIWQIKFTATGFTLAGAFNTVAKIPPLPGNPIVPDIVYYATYRPL